MVLDNNKILVNLYKQIEINVTYPSVDAVITATLPLSLDESIWELPDENILN